MLEVELTPKILEDYISKIKSGEISPEEMMSEIHEKHGFIPLEEDTVYTVSGKLLIDLFETIRKHIISHDPIEQQLYVYKRMLKEFLDDHSYDAMREFAWYTGWWFNAGPNFLKEIDREDGAFACYKDLPHIELSRDEVKKFLKGVI